VTATVPSPAILRARPILVTGGAGFVGSNLADRLARDGHDVLVFDALVRPGVARNLDWLKGRHPRRITALVADIRDQGALRDAAMRCSGVYHLAAQVAVTTSLVEPMDDFDVNVRGTMHLLEALRRRVDRVPMVFASTNKVYGDLNDITLADRGGAYLPVDAAIRDRGVGEDRPLDFHTPYGCSKGAADQYVLDYARSFGIPACVMRMSCIYGPRQMGTEDQGWLAHFLISVLDGRPVSIYGDGRQVRDVLFVDDAVEAYVRATARIGQVAGQVFNLGGGPRNAVTLLAVLDAIKAATGRTPDIQFADWRPGDQRYFVADTSRIQAALDLAPPVGWRDGLGRLARWLMAERAGQAEAADA
jgi:CDP-paratose 2-epimerase